MRHPLIVLVLIFVLDSAGCSEDLGFGLLRNPQVDTVEPAVGPTGGGDEVTITGENFIENTEFLFGDKPCLDVTIVSETQAVCYTPIHTAGEVEVMATHAERGDGTRTATYLFEPPPRFSLHPGDEVGYTKINVKHCESDFCTPENETEVAWRSTWVIEGDDDAVKLSSETGFWEVRARFFHQVNSVKTGAGDPVALFADTWLAEFGPFDQVSGYSEDGIGTYTTSLPPMPGTGGAAFPFFDMNNAWESGERAFRDYVRGLDPSAEFNSQRAARRMEAYYIDSASPQRAHHIWIIFSSVGIVCSVDEEVANLDGRTPTRTQADFTGVLIYPNTNAAFAYVQRAGAISKSFCNCASQDGNEGCE